MATTTLPGAPTANAWLGTAVRVAGAVLAVGPFLPPIVNHLGAHSLATVLDTLWVPMCHRMPERSLSYLGEVMPLCTRCLGLVVGLGLGMAIARPALSIKALRIAVSVGLAFLFVELTTQDLGWHPVFHPTRILSGLLVAYPVGAAAGALARKLSQERRLGPDPPLTRV